MPDRQRIRQSRHWRRPKRTSRALPRRFKRVPAGRAPARTYNSRITHPATVDGAGYRPFLDVSVGGEGLVIAVFFSWGSSCRRCAAIADLANPGAFIFHDFLVKQLSFTCRRSTRTARRRSSFWCGIRSLLRRRDLLARARLWPRLAIPASDRERRGLHAVTLDDGA